jgi:hypothetical protein
MHPNQSEHINVHYQEAHISSVNATQARKEFFNLIKEAVTQHKISKFTTGREMLC